MLSRGTEGKWACTCMVIEDVLAEEDIDETILQGGLICHHTEDMLATLMQPGDGGFCKRSWIKGVCVCVFAS